ncbi:MAG: PDZ domain-containing protein, partial [Actinomycetota bacterium]
MTVVASFIILFAILGLNVPYVSLEPGPSRDVAGLITISDPARRDVNGELLLTTVSLRTPPLRVGYIVAGLFDPNDLILPRDRVYRSDETAEEADRLAAAQMVTSQESAGAAALSLLGYDVKIETLGVVVLGLPPYGTAREKLRRGDIVSQIDDRPIRTGEDFGGAIDARSIGDEVVVEVLRGRGRQRVTLKTVESPDRPGEPVIGVEFSPVPIKQATLPIDIAIDAQGIGGPSAGLMYALGIVDMLNTDDLARGRRIAGTGEIEIDGIVGAVG